jgi:hypothetical protein
MESAKRWNGRSGLYRLLDSLTFAPFASQQFSNPAWRAITALAATSDRAVLELRCCAHADSRGTVAHASSNQASQPRRRGAVAIIVFASAVFAVATAAARA